MRTLEEGELAGVERGEGDGLRFTRFALGSSSCFSTLLTPVSHEGILLQGIKPGKEAARQISNLGTILH